MTHCDVYLLLNIINTLLMNIMRRVLTNIILALSSLIIFILSRRDSSATADANPSALSAPLITFLSPALHLSSAASPRA